MKISPVDLVENRLTDRNCTACSHYGSTANNRSCYSYCKVHDIMHPASDHLTYVPLARLACSICQGTLPWQPNNVGWKEKVMKADWYHVHSLHVCQGCSTVMFRYYLLAGDTAAPSGLYARLCHAFLVSLLHCRDVTCCIWPLSVNRMSDIILFTSSVALIFLLTRVMIFA